MNIMNSLKSVFRIIRINDNQNRVPVPFFLFIYLFYILFVFSIDLFHFTSSFFPANPFIPVFLIIIYSLILILILINMIKIEADRFDLIDYLVFLFLLTLFLMRLPYPDNNFDTPNYHLFLQNFQFKSNFTYNFLPVSFYSFLFPLSDRLFYLFRDILGYRAGTLLNFLVVILIYKQVKDFLLRYARLKNIKISGLLPGIFALLVISTEFILINFATYLVDLLFIPLLLEVLKLIIFREDDSPKWFYYCAVLSGFALSLKFTAVIFIIILLGLFLFRSRRGINLKTLLVSSILFFLPVSIYTIFNYINTGNPVFPFFNKLFQSPYYLSLSSDKDERWGPVKNIFEYLFWPAYCFFVPKRLSELNVYSGRMFLGYCFSLIFSSAMILKRDISGKIVKIISCLILSGGFLWGITTGYVRYGLFIEVLSGIVLSLICLELLAAPGKKNARPQGIMILFLFSMQVLFCYGLYIKGLNWAWRPPFYKNIPDYISNFSMIGKDRNVIGKDEIKLIKRIDMWVITRTLPGYSSLLKDNVPIFGFYNNSPMPLIKIQFRKFYDKITNQRIFEIYENHDIQKALPGLTNNYHSLGFDFVNYSLIHPAYLPDGGSVYLLELRKSPAGAGFQF